MKIIVKRNERRKKDKKNFKVTSHLLQKKTEKRKEKKKLSTNAGLKIIIAVRYQQNRTYLSR
jgi:hypothetical protein